MDIKGFKDYLILEKIEQREFKKVFADDTIRIGIEFECYIDDLELGNSALVEGAASAYEGLVRDVDNYVDALVQSKVDWHDEITENIGRFIMGKKIEISNLEDESEKYTEQDLAGLIFDIEAEIAKAKTLNPNDIENSKLDIDYVDPYEWSDDVYVPSIPIELEHYLVDYLGVSNSTLESEVNEFIFSAGYEEGDFEQDMQVAGYAVYQDEYGSQEGTTVEDLENWDWDSNFPFNNYIIGEYHGSSSFHQWRIELDPSTGENGVEIISPIMKLQDALPVMKKMFDFIGEYGGTTRDHGMHVNISKKGAGTDTVDLLKLMLFVDEGFVWKKFPDRVGNYYADSVLDDIIKIVKDEGRGIVKEIDAKRKLEKLEDASNIIFTSFKSKLNLPKEKYKGVNFSNLHAGSGRIEMRYLGGADYHKKYKENVSAIGRYVYYLLLSLDKNFKKREYLKKLLRLSTKFEKKNINKIDKREFEKIVLMKNKVGTVVNNNGDAKSTYFKLGKFVYEVVNYEIVNRISLINWRGVKSKLRNYVPILSMDELIS